MQDGETGLLFRDGCVEHLVGQLKRLASDYSLRMQMRQKAWEMMQNIWHPRVAAERLVKLCEGLHAGQPPCFEEGPVARVTTEPNPKWK